DVDVLGVAGALDPDVGRLQVAVSDAVAMQRPQAGQAFAEDLDGHAGLQTRLGDAGRENHVGDVPPALRAESFPGPVVKPLREQIAQAEAVNPLHDHDANA